MHLAFHLPVALAETEGGEDGVVIAAKPLREDAEFGLFGVCQPRGQRIRIHGVDHRHEAVAKRADRGQRGTLLLKRRAERAFVIRQTRIVVPKEPRRLARRGDGHRRTWCGRPLGRHARARTRLSGRGEIAVELPRAEEVVDQTATDAGLVSDGRLAEALVEEVAQ